MTAKMVSKPHRNDSRPDWNQIRVRVMRWTLRVKLAMHWQKFGGLLLETGDKPIVEDSRRDEFWGALQQENGTLVGMNVLGRLLMELREELKGPNKESLRVVGPPPIVDFMLLGQPIKEVGFGSKAGGVVADPDAEAKPGTIWASQIDGPETELDDADAAVGAGVANEDPSREQEKAGHTMHYPKRLIEVDLPIKRISAHARREKSIRHGHISTLHIWWARRPLAACRAVICAALWPDPADKLCPASFREAAERVMRDFAEAAVSNKDIAEICDGESWKRYGEVAKGGKPIAPERLRGLLLDFIGDVAAWEASTNKVFLTTARRLTQAAHEALGGAPGTRPLVVDPFAGGGAIPLEALRVGADAFASDLNPVAVLLNKVVLEYIPKHGRRLADEVHKWGEWVKEHAEKELAEFYPKDPDGATPIAYLWARTIKCEGPGCGAEVPLVRNLWLAKKRSSSVALRIVPDLKSKRVDFAIIEKAKASDVTSGNVARGSATCPCCSYTTSVEAVRSQLAERHGGSHDSRLLCVVTLRPNGRG